MDIQVVESGPCRRSLTITIPPEKIKAHVDEVYHSASHQVQIKGFRSGKIPRKVLEKKFGPAILAEAKESLINSCFEEAVRSKEIAFVGQPDVEGLDETPLAEDQALEFQVHLDIKPEIELKQVKGLQVKAESTEVTDEDLEHGLNQLAEQKRSLNPVDEPIEDGDFAKADLVFKDGEGNEVHRREAAQLNTNIPVAGTDKDVFKSKLIGTDKGGSFSIELKFPESFEKEEVRGQEGTVEVTVHEVMRVTSPPIDDEFAKGFEFDNLDALKEELHKRIGEEKVRGDKARIEQDLIQQIIAANPFPLPESMVKDQKQHLLAQAGQEMQRQGLPEEQIKGELEKHDAEAAQEAEQRVRVFFVLDTIARNEKIFVTEGDVDVELRNIAASNNASPEEAKKYYEENNLIGDLRLGIMERKVREFLRENAEVTDK